MLGFSVGNSLLSVAWSPAGSVDKIISFFHCLFLLYFILLSFFIDLFLFLETEKLYFLLIIIYNHFLPPRSVSNHLYMYVLIYCIHV